jgi:hypothetical protein
LSINKIITAILLALATAYCTSNSPPYDSVFVKRLEIPVGKGEAQVQWSKFGENDGVVTLGGFLVSDSGEFFFIEGRKRFIKVFDTAGTYLRKILAPDAYPFFMVDSSIYGYGVDANGLVGFSKRDGKIFFKQKAPFGNNWDPYEMDEGKLFFSSEGFGLGQIKYFDTKRRVFDANPNLQQYSDNQLNQLSTTLTNKGYEKIGRLDDCLVFRKIHLEEKIPCSYKIIVATEKGSELSKYEMTFSENDIGYIMPDVPWVLKQGKFVYTVGFRRTGKKIDKKIIVTGIDLQKAFPLLFAGPPR